MKQSTAFILMLALIIGGFAGVQCGMLFDRVYARMRVRARAQTKQLIRREANTIMRYPKMEVRICSPESCNTILQK